MGRRHLLLVVTAGIVLLHGVPACVGGTDGTDLNPQPLPPVVEDNDGRGPSEGEASGGSSGGMSPGASADAAAGADADAGDDAGDAGEGGPR